MWNAIYTTYIQMAPYLFIGLLFAGFMHLIFTRNMIAKHLGDNNLLSVIKASILGVPLPLCSCGVIPTALYLRKQKASAGATISFLISTPQTGIDSIVATYGLMGPVFAIFRPIAAFITGIF
ncbi:MAG: permease, partial [Candidatus Cloacimonadota bacterium]|nr:permease [Candidatus Cloacimonadota bacterium]